MVSLYKFWCVGYPFSASANGFQFYCILILGLGHILLAWTLDIIRETDPIPYMRSAEHHLWWHFEVEDWYLPQRHC